MEFDSVVNFYDTFGGPTPLENDDKNAKTTVVSRPQKKRKISQYWDKSDTLPRNDAQLSPTTSERN